MERKAWQRRRACQAAQLVAANTESEAEESQAGQVFKQIIWAAEHRTEQSIGWPTDRPMDKSREETVTSSSCGSAASLWGQEGNDN